MSLNAVDGGYNPLTPAEIAELEAKYAMRNDNAGEQILWWSEASAAFPGLVARIRYLEAKCNALAEDSEIDVSVIRDLDPSLCDFNFMHGCEEYLRQWLAARDASMKKLGAAEAWSIVAERSRAVRDQSGEKYARSQDAKLREGGE